MVVSGVGDSGPLVVYLFGDAAEEFANGSRRWAVGCSLRGRSRCCVIWRWAGTLSTSRSRWGVSRHTVRDYSTNLRRKLDVRSSLGAVMAAVRLGVLTFDDAGYVHGES